MLEGFPLYWILNPMIPNIKHKDDITQKVCIGIYLYVFLLTVIDSW